MAWVQQPPASINRAFTLLHSCVLLASLFYRATTIFSSPTTTLLLAQTLAFMSEAAFAFFWLLRRPFGWRPTSREVFPERLLADERLPNIDVFVCSADPEKEPVVEVMNTVIAAMSMDYPAEKLAVYLSDYGGSPATLNALREVAAFAAAWLPYCRKYGVVTRSLEAYYFSSPVLLGGVNGSKQELSEDREKMKVIT